MARVGRVGGHAPILRRPRGLCHSVRNLLRHHRSPDDCRGRRLHRGALAASGSRDRGQGAVPTQATREVGPQAWASSLDADHRGPRQEEARHAGRWCSEDGVPDIHGRGDRTILRNLPETSRSRKARGTQYPVRARFEIAWETALRPETIDRLRAPDDYRVGATELTIRAEADKNRYARSLPLSPGARAALDGVCPESGVIFGAHDYHHCLRKAARAAGIDRLRAGRISDYDFRHSRPTHLGQVSDNVVGIMYIAGHTQLATTSRYVNPPKEATQEVLAKAVAASNSAERSRSEIAVLRAFRAPFSSAPEMPGRRKKTAEEAGDPEISSFLGELGPVRGGGIEPPWLLTASTSTHAGASNDAISRTCARRETSASVSERQVSAARSQNPTTGHEDRGGSIVPESVTGYTQLGETVMITVEISEATLAALDTSPAGAAAKVRLAAAMKLYEIGQLSSGAAAELAGIPKPVFLSKLAEFGIDAFRMSREELERDVKNALPRHG